MFLSKIAKGWNVKQMFEKSEVKFKRKLKQNPIYPFSETEEDYIMEFHSPRLLVGIMLFVASGLGGAIYWNEMRQFSNEVFDTGFVLLCLWSLRIIYYNLLVRRIVIEKDGQHYFFYVGGELVFRGDIHNIYLRLRGQHSSNGSSYYRLVLNGFHVEEQDITTMTTNKTELEQLAKKLAFRMNINYFDAEDVSTSHIVRHINPKTFYMRPSIKKAAPRKAKRMSIAKATLDAFY